MAWRRPKLINELLEWDYLSYIEALAEFRTISGGIPYHRYYVDLDFEVEKWPDKIKKYNAREDKLYPPKEPLTLEGAKRLFKKMADNRLVCHAWKDTYYFTAAATTLYGRGLFPEQFDVVNVGEKPALRLAQESIEIAKKAPGWKFTHRPTIMGWIDMYAIEDPEIYDAVFHLMKIGLFNGLVDPKNRAKLTGYVTTDPYSIEVDDEWAREGTDIYDGKVIGERIARDAMRKFLADTIGYPSDEAAPKTRSHVDEEVARRAEAIREAKREAERETENSGRNQAPARIAG